MDIVGRYEDEDMVQTIYDLVLEPLYRRHHGRFFSDLTDYQRCLRLSASIGGITEPEEHLRQ